MQFIKKRVINIKNKIILDMGKILDFIGDYWYFIIFIICLAYLIIHRIIKNEYNKYEHFNDVQIYSDHDIFHRGAAEKSFYYGEVKRLKEIKIDPKNNKEYRIYFYKDKNRVWHRMRKKHIHDFEKNLAEDKLTFSIH